MRSGDYKTAMFELNIIIILNDALINFNNWFHLSKKLLTRGDAKEFWRASFQRNTYFHYLTNLHEDKQNQNSLPFFCRLSYSAP